MTHEDAIELIRVLKVLGCVVAIIASCEARKMFIK